MAKNDFQYGGWNYYTLQCGTIMTLISPGDCTLQCACGSGIITVNSTSGSTLQCDTWLWYDMPLNSPVAAPCNVAGSCVMTCHGIRPNVRHLVSILTISPQSTCHSTPVCEILSKSDHPQDGGSQPSWILGVQ